MDSSEGGAVFPRRWQVTVVGRALAAILIVGIVGSALYIAQDPYRLPGDGPYDHYFIALGLALLGFCFWRGSFYPYIEADVGGLTVRNPLGTRQVGWSEIRHVSPGYSGLVIRLENERSVTAWAVQEANVAAWLRRPTRSKRIAKEIVDLAALECDPSRPRPV